MPCTARPLLTCLRLAAEVQQGAKAQSSNAGPATAVEARFGLPNQQSTAAIQTCLQTGVHAVTLPTTASLSTPVLFFTGHPA